MINSNKYPKFSVLMSVYKEENSTFLDESLKSIENQTIQPDEIVLVKDGPLSNSLEKTIKKHKALFKKKFKIVQIEQNSGLAIALQIGTNYVSNEIIARMDSDDISVKTRFQKQLDALVNNPDVMLVGGQVKEFSGYLTNVTGSRKVPLYNELITDFVKWRNPFNHPTVMMRKKALKKVGGYVPFGNIEDYYLWVRFIVSGYKVMNLPDVLTYMRVDNGLYSRRGKISNIIFFFKLRTYMRKRNLLNLSNEVLGDVVVTLNIIMPNYLRKILYQNLLHK